jgi:uncharacterized membrane protein YfcA
MIAPEGKIILIPLLLLVLAGTGIQAYYPSEGFKWINLTMALLTLFSLYFFRDPQRIPPDKNPSLFGGIRWGSLKKYNENRVNKAMVKFIHLNPSEG